MEWSNPWLIGVLALVAGIALGALVAGLLARRASGGKTVAALREEFDDYRGDVNEHFEKTSELFREMTEKYRDVYSHLATGAQTFGKDLDAAPRLELVEDDRLPPACEDAAGEQNPPGGPSADANQSQAATSAESVTDAAPAQPVEAR